MNNVKRAGRPLVALAASAALLALAGSGAAAVGSLPGGTAISVEITSPGHNAVVPEGPLAVAGSSSVGEGEPVASTLLVYVLDLSGSTTGGVSPGSAEARTSTVSRTRSSTARSRLPRP